MKSRTISSVCSYLHGLVSPNLPGIIKKDLLAAIEKIKIGECADALKALTKARCDSALANQDNTVYISGTEEIALLMVYQAKSLIVLADVSECLGPWAKSGKLKDAISERERSLRQMAS